MAKASKIKDGEKEELKKLRKAVKRIMVTRHGISKDITLEDVAQLRDELTAEAEAKWYQDNAEEKDPQRLNWQSSHLVVVPIRDTEEKKVKRYGKMMTRKVPVKDPEAWHYRASLVVYYNDPTISLNTEVRTYRLQYRLDSEDLADFEATKQDRINDFKLRCAFNDYTLDEATIKCSYHESSNNLIVHGTVRFKSIDFCNRRIEVWEAYQDGQYYATMQIDPMVRERAVKRAIKPYTQLYAKCADFLGSMVETHILVSQCNDEIGPLKELRSAISANITKTNKRLDKVTDEITKITDELDVVKKRRSDKAKAQQTKLRKQLKTLRDRDSRIRGSLDELHEQLKPVRSKLASFCTKLGKGQKAAIDNVNIFFIVDTDARAECMARMLQMEEAEAMMLAQNARHGDYKRCYDMIDKHCLYVQTFNQYIDYYQGLADKAGEEAAREVAKARCKHLKKYTPDTGIEYRYIMNLDNIKQTDDDDE